MQRSSPTAGSLEMHHSAKVGYLAEYIYTHRVGVQGSIRCPEFQPSRVRSRRLGEEPYRNLSVHLHLDRLCRKHISRRCVTPGTERWRSHARKRRTSRSEIFGDTFETNVTKPSSTRTPRLRRISSATVGSGTSPC